MLLFCFFQEFWLEHRNSAQYITSLISNRVNLNVQTSLLGSLSFLARSKHLLFTPEKYRARIERGQVDIFCCSDIAANLKRLSLQL